MGIGPNQFGGFVHFKEAHIPATLHIEENALRPLNRDIQKRAVNGFLRGFLCPIFAAGAANCHKRRATVLHNRAHIGKVQIDQTGHCNQFTDALNTLAQHIIGHRKGLTDSRLFVQNVEESVVGDGNQRIHIFPQPDHSCLGHASALVSLETKGFGHDPNRQGAHLFGNPCDDGRCTRTCTAAHARSHKNHIRAFQHRFDLFPALLGCA